MKTKSVAWFVVFLTLPVHWSCSPAQPVAKTATAAPVTQINPPAEPVTDGGGVADLQQQLAGTLTPSYNFPDIEEFKRGEIHQFDDPRYGYRVAYDSIEPKITVTAYVYSRGLADIPDGIESQLAKAQVDEVEQSLNEMVRRGYYSSCERRGDGERPFGAGKALWRSFELDSEEGQLASETYVTAAQHSFFKVRGTYGLECGEDCEKKLAELIGRLGELVWPTKSD